MDAKKALSGFSGSAGGGGTSGNAGVGYMPPYLDFKKSPLFSNCYNYPPQMPHHLPFIPFGYHGMMNLAMAGSQLAALQRRGGDDLAQRFTMSSGARPPPADSRTPSQRCDQSSLYTPMCKCENINGNRTVSHKRNGVDHA